MICPCAIASNKPTSRAAVLDLLNRIVPIGQEAKAPIDLGNPTYGASENAVRHGFSIIFRIWYWNRSRARLRGWQHKFGGRQDYPCMMPLLLPPLGFKPAQPLLVVRTVGMAKRGRVSILMCRRLFILN